MEWAIKDKPTQLTSKELVRLVRKELYKIGLKAPIKTIVSKDLEFSDLDAVITYPSKRSDEPVLLLELNPSLKRDSTDYIRYVIQHEIKHYRSAKRKYQGLPFYQREETLNLPESISWKPEKVV